MPSRLLAPLLIVATLLPSASAEPRGCPQGVIERAAAAVGYERSESALAAACAPWFPDQRATVVALVKDIAGRDELPLTIAIIDDETGRALATNTSAVLLDASWQVTEHYLKIDTSAYPLARGVRAFAVTESGERSSQAQDHGSNGIFSLYVREGTVLRRVMTLPHTVLWRVDTPNSHTAKRVYAQLSLTVEHTATRGYADLLATFVEAESSTLVFRERIVYDGSKYNTKALETRLYSWWQQ